MRVLTSSSHPHSTMMASHWPVFILACQIAGGAVPGSSTTHTSRRRGHGGREAGEGGGRLRGQATRSSTATWGLGSPDSALQICRKTWFIRHGGLWNAVLSPAGENQYEMLGKKIQLSCEIRPLECTKGKGGSGKRHKPYAASIKTFYEPAFGTSRGRRLCL